MSHPPYWIFPVSNTPKAAIFETYIDVYLNTKIIMIYIIVDNKGKKCKYFDFPYKDYQPEPSSLDKPR